MGLLYHEDKDFAGGALENRRITAVYYGAELLWPHLPVNIKVDTSISNTLTIQGIDGKSVSWGDGASETAAANSISHTYATAGIYDVKVDGLSEIPSNFLSIQSNVVEISTHIKIVGIGNLAFNGCSAITTFNVDLSQCVNLGFDAFRNAFAPGSHIELNFSNPGLIIAPVAGGDYGTFHSSKIHRITIHPNATSSIARGMFSSCSELVEVNLGQPVQIGDSAFQNCSAITAFNVDLTHTVDLGIDSFRGAFAPGSHIELNFSNPGLIIAPVAGGDYGTFHSSKIYRITIHPNATSSIARGMFNNCNELIEVNLGKPVQIGDSAFQNCSAITAFNVDLSQTIYLGVDTFRSSFAPGSHIELNFSNPGLTIALITGGNYGTFHSSKIYRITFNQDTVADVVRGMFYGCNELIEVDLGKPNQYIETDAFASAVSLQKIRIYATVPPVLNSTIPVNSLQTIYVPAASLSAYQGATNWIAYASYMSGF